MIDTLKKHLQPDSKNIATIKICLVSFLHACLVASIAGDIFAIWLQDKIHLNGTEIGILLGLKGGVAIFFKPFFGYFLDKLLLKKHLMYAIAVCAVGTGPFFQFIYGPLLKTTHEVTNMVDGVATISTTHPYLYVTALLGGLYLGFMFYAGTGVIYSYCDRYIRAHGGTYGIVNAFNLAGWGVMAPISGFLYVYGAIYTFYFVSGLAIILFGVIFSLNVRPFDVEEEKEEKDKEESESVRNKVIPKEKAQFKDYFRLLKNKNFYNLIIFNIFIVVVFYVQNGQSGRYFLTFYGTDKISHAHAIQIMSWLGIPASIIAFVFSIYSSKIIDKIGVQKGMIILSFCVAGYFFIAGCAGEIHSRPIIITARLLFAIVNPLITVVVLGYIASYFNAKINGMVFLIGFHLINNLGGLIENPIIGRLFDYYGFANTFIILAVVVSAGAIVIFISLTFLNKKIVMRHLKTKIDK